MYARDSGDPPGVVLPLSRVIRGVQPEDRLSGTSADLIDGKSGLIRYVERVEKEIEIIIREAGFRQIAD